MNLSWQPIKCAKIVKTAVKLCQRTCKATMTEGETPPLFGTPDAGPF